MALGTQFWDKVVSYPDFGNGRVGFPAIPDELAPNNKGGYCIVDSPTIVPVAATTTPFNTFKASFAGSDAFNTGSALYDAFVRNNFTYEAWVFPTNVTGIHMLFGGGTNQLSIYLSDSRVVVGDLNTTTLVAGVLGSVPINTWTKVAVTRINNVLRIYINNVLNATSSTISTGLVTTGLYRHGRSYLNTYAFLGSLAEILITAEGKTTFTSLATSYPRYAAQVIGTITESLNITSWTITGVSSTGLSCSTVTSSSSYTLNCPSLEPYTITCSPTVNGSWTATKTIQSGYFVVATNTDTNSNLYVCTTAGTTGGTEPTFISPTHTDGTVVWTLVGGLVNPISLGTRVPS